MGVPRLTDDQMCFGCGRRNPKGLKLTFSADPRRKRLRARWVPSKEFQGYAEIVHGGMIGLVLDELMGNLLWLQKSPAVTAQMTVSFLRPARVGQPLECEACVVERKGRLFRMEAEAKTSAGQLVARVNARFISMKK